MENIDLLTIKQVDIYIRKKNYLKSIALNFNIKQNWATPLTIQLNAYRCGLSKLSSSIHVDEMVVIVCHPDHDGLTCLSIDFVDNVDLKLQELAKGRLCSENTQSSMTSSKKKRKNESNNENPTKKPVLTEPMLTEKIIENKFDSFVAFVDSFKDKDKAHASVCRSECVETLKSFCLSGLDWRSCSLNDYVVCGGANASDDIINVLFVLQDPSAKQDAASIRFLHESLATLPRIVNASFIDVIPVDVLQHVRAELGPNSSIIDVDGVDLLAQHLFEYHFQEFVDIDKQSFDLVVVCGVLATAVVAPNVEPANAPCFLDNFNGSKLGSKILFLKHPSAYLRHSNSSKSLLDTVNTVGYGLSRCLKIDFTPLTTLHFAFQNNHSTTIQQMLSASPPINETVQYIQHKHLTNTIVAPVQTTDNFFDVIEEIKFGNSNHLVCSAIFFPPKTIRLMNYSQYLSLLRQLKWNFTKQRRILSHILHSKSIVDTTTVRLHEHRYFTTGDLSQTVAKVVIHNDFDNNVVGGNKKIKGGKIGIKSLTKLLYKTFNVSKKAEKMTSVNSFTTNNADIESLTGAFDILRVSNQSTEALPTENDLPFVTDNLENERYWRIVQKDWRAASGQGMRIMNKEGDEIPRLFAYLSSSEKAVRNRFLQHIEELDVVNDECVEEFLKLEQSKQQLFSIIVYRNALAGFWCPTK